MAEWEDLSDLGDLLWEHLTDELFSELPGDKPRQNVVLRSLGTSCNLLAEAHDRELGTWTDDKQPAATLAPDHAAALAAGTWTDSSDFCPSCHTAGLRKRHQNCHPVR